MSFTWYNFAFQPLIIDMDKVTLQRIEKLHPLVREEVKQIIKDCDEALAGKAKVRVTQGLRSFEEQEKLYAIGRITLGKKVTNANAPNLFEMMQSPQGYEQVEQMVIRKVLHDQMVPAAVIPLIESELEMI